MKVNIVREHVYIRNSTSLICSTVDYQAIGSTETYVLKPRSLCFGLYHPLLSSMLPVGRFDCWNIKSVAYKAYI